MLSTTPALPTEGNASAQITAGTDPAPSADIDHKNELLSQLYDQLTALSAIPDSISRDLTHPRSGQALAYDTLLEGTARTAIEYRKTIEAQEVTIPHQRDYLATEIERTLQSLNNLAPPSREREGTSKTSPHRSSYLWPEAHKSVQHSIVRLHRSLRTVCRDHAMRLARSRCTELLADLAADRSARQHPGSSGRSRRRRAKYEKDMTKQELRTRMLFICYLTNDYRGTGDRLPPRPTLRAVMSRTTTHLTRTWR